MNDRPAPLDAERVAKVNLDLSERLFKEGVSLTYDKDGDTLFITIGQARPAITTHLVDGIYFRVHPESLQIVGCTIVAFASDLLANNKLMRKLFPSALQDLEESGGVIEWRGLQAQRMLPVFEAGIAR